MLTVGIATYDDQTGLYFTLQALRLYHPRVEVLVLDNAPRSCPRSAAMTRAAGGRYVHRPDLSGTSASRDALFRLATTPWVLVCDSHVLFEPGAIAESIRYAEANPDSRDVVQGPLVSDDGRGLSTHWRPTHPPGLWGVWDHDPRVGGGEPFEVPMQGLGMWLMRRDAWPGFNPLFRGFGGEEGYLHEKVRQRGGRALCHPALGWRHLFRDPTQPVPYKPSLADHTFNLLVGHRELGLDAGAQIREAFGKRLPAGVFEALVAEAGAVQPFGTHRDRPPRQKLLGVWYSNNAAPPKLLRDSLGTVERARDASRHEVRVATCSWDPVPGNPFPSALHKPASQGHAAIVEQVRRAIGVGTAGAGTEGGAWVPDAVCFLEHDVLYPPHYFDTVGDAFAGNPAAPVVSHLNYEGLNATGWLAVKERHEPLHQLSMRWAAALENLDRAEADCRRQGWALLEPQGDRSAWVRLGRLTDWPAVHVNHPRRLTSHGEVCYEADARGRVDHPYWGRAADWWPDEGAPPKGKKGCGGCAARQVQPPPPPPPRYPNLDAWYAAAAAAPSDFRAHLPVLRDLAARCGHVTEVSSWLKPALVALAAGCPGTVVSAATGPKPEWADLRAMLGERFGHRVADPLALDLAGTDLLFLDERHAAAAVLAQLTRFAPAVRKYVVIHTTETHGEHGDDGGPGVMPAVRLFLSRNREWKVVHYSREDHGLIVLSRAEEDRVPLPSVAAMGWNYLKAKVGHWARGGGYLPLPLAEERLAECWVCPLRQDSRCTKCGCYLDVVDPDGTDPRVPPTERGKPGRAFLPHLDCPVGKWHAAEPRAGEEVVPLTPVAAGPG